MTKKQRKKPLYSDRNFFVKFWHFCKALFEDLATMEKNPHLFKEFGVTLFCGAQGNGKTVSMNEYLVRMRQKYPKVMIVTNFGYADEDRAFESWNDILTVRNGDEGVIFAIDELQNEFSTALSKNFPESLLGEITQQRKQRIKIVGTSQVFTRVAKPIREQTYEVVECRTIAGRWTFQKCFEADEYNDMIDAPVALKHKIRRKWRRNFVQDKHLRELFDSYKKVERIKGQEYIKNNNAF